jgi:uncharacterized protein with HEPN domain
MPREELYLHDIISATIVIENFLLNVDRDQFFDSELLQSGVLHKLTIIGEACSKLPKDLRDKHPGIAWKQIIGFRNVAVHAYFSVNLEIVWETSTTRLKSLREQITKILKSDFPDFEYKPKN